MRVKLLKRLKKKAKARTWVEYFARHYRACKINNNYCISSTCGVKKLEIALEDLAKFRRHLILKWIQDMREKKINRELRDL